MGRQIYIANPGDRGYWPAWVLAFGPYGDLYVLAYAKCLEDALDECVDWIADNAPGLLADDEVADEYRRVLTEHVAAGADPTDERVIEAAQAVAEIDTTIAGNYGHYLHSWQWQICLEDPTKEALISFAKGR
jgi:hypothetical protein